MKFSQLLTIHAILAIGLGIAFALYGPIMLALFGVPEIAGGQALMYWNVAAFARMFGAALLGLGLVLFALRALEGSEVRRGLAFALLLGNLVALVVALTQQVSVWDRPVGWAAVGLFALLSGGYAWTLAVENRETEAATPAAR